MYVPRNALNMGLSAERTSGTLWRLEHGDIDGISPKLVVLLIGTNSSAEQPPEYVADGIKAVVNKIISKLADDKVVFFMDIGANFLNPDGTVNSNIRPDKLHLTAQGYKTWAEAIEPTVKKLMGEE